MATALKLRADIKKLKKALETKGISASVKEKLKTQLEKAEAELAAVKKGKAPKTSSTKGTKTALSKLQSLVKRKKYGAYKAQGVDLERDADRPAKPSGKRKSKSGNTYYEYRANRIDVKQPPKRYPKLEDGGMMAKGGILKEEDFVWNAAGKKLIVDKVTDDEYYLVGFGSPSPSPFSKQKVDNYIKSGDWTLKPKMASGGYMAKGGETHRYEKGGYMAKGGLTRTKGGATDDLLEFVIPDWAMPAIVNYDRSGLYDEDIERLDNFLDSLVKKYGNANLMLGDVDGKDDLGTGYGNDIDGNLGSKSFRMYLRPTKDYAKGGGEMAKGGKLSLSDFKKKYEENEDNNYHSENVVLLAENFGTDQDIKDAKRILALHDAIGSLPSFLANERRELEEKLWQKYQAASK